MQQPSTSQPEESWQELMAAARQELNLAYKKFYVSLGMTAISALFASIGIARRQNRNLNTYDLYLHMYELNPDHLKDFEKLYYNLDIVELLPQLPESIDELFGINSDNLFDPNLYAKLANATTLDDDLINAFKQYINVIITADEEPVFGSIVSGLDDTAMKMLTDDEINSLVSKVFWLIKNGITKAPQFVGFEFNHGIATLNFQSLMPGRHLNYAKVTHLLENSHNLLQIRLENLDYSLLAADLLNHLEAIFKFYATKTTSCVVTFTSHPQDPFQYALAAFARHVRRQVTKHEYHAQDPILFAPSDMYDQALNSANVVKQRMSAEVFNIYTGYGSFAKHYSYNDIARAIRNKTDDLFARPEFLDFFSKRIGRVHDSVLFKVYLHAIVTQQENLRLVCEAKIPVNLKINLTFNQHGTVTVPALDYSIYDALLLQHAGATIDTKNLNTRQAQIFTDPSFHDLCRRPLSTLIYYKKFINNLNDSGRPEITLKRLRTFDTMRTVANALATKPNLLNKRVTNTILDYIGKAPKPEPAHRSWLHVAFFGYEETVQYEYMPLTEADPNSNKAVRSVSTCKLQ